MTGYHEWADAPRITLMLTKIYSCNIVYIPMIEASTKRLRMVPFGSKSEDNLLS